MVFGDITKLVESDIEGAINPAVTAEISQMTPEEQTRAKGGAGQKIKLEASPPMIEGKCEEILRSKGGNAFLVLGRDRPGSLMSGYGGSKNHPASSAIRLTAGMGGRDVKEIKEGQAGMIDPNNQIDAATIYLSQKTDIDHKEAGFNLKPGTVGNIKGRSAIAIKADAVRILSRDGGIKLVTGCDLKHSQGEEYQSYNNIEFVVGNDDSDLQPLVKGHNLQLAIERIFFYISELALTVNGFVQMQNKFNLVLQSHTHPVPQITVPPMSTTPGAGTGATNLGVPVNITTAGAKTIPPPPLLVGVGTNLVGRTGPNPVVASVGAETVAQLADITTQRLMALDGDCWGSNKNYVQNPHDPHYLVSNNVWTS